MTLMSSRTNSQTIQFNEQLPLLMFHDNKRKKDLLVSDGFYKELNEYIGDVCYVAAYRYLNS